MIEDCHEPNPCNSFNLRCRLFHRQHFRLQCCLERTFGEVYRCQTLLSGERTKTENGNENGSGIGMGTANDLEVSGIKFHYGKREILKGTGFCARRGEVCLLLGANGAGKSTLLRCLNYLEKPDSGEIQIGDFSANFDHITKAEIHQLRKYTSMVFQQYNLFKNKTVLQNVTEGLVIVQKKSKEEAEEIASRCLKQVGMYDKKDAYPSTLSGGQQQRVGIARALAINPEVILFDEPTSALDPSLTLDVAKLIKSLSKTGMSMLIITHDMEFAKLVSDKIVSMDSGKIIEKHIYNKCEII